MKHHFDYQFAKLKHALPKAHFGCKHVMDCDFNYVGWWNGKLHISETYPHRQALKDYLNSWEINYEKEII